MHAFQYHRPASTKEALSLAQQKGEGRYLAGGQSLVQAMKLRLTSPSDLIDLGSIADLKSLKVEGNAVSIGAMVRHAEVAGSSSVKKAIPSLAALAGVFVADFGSGNVRVGVTGAGASAFRQGEMEKALSAKFAPEAVASIKVKPDGLNNDLHASPEYRAHLITIMAKRAVEAALK